MTSFGDLTNTVEHFPLNIYLFLVAFRAAGKAITITQLGDGTAGHATPNSSFQRFQTILNDETLLFHILYYDFNCAKKYCI